MPGPCSGARQGGRGARQGRGSPALPRDDDPSRHPTWGPTWKVVIFVAQCVATAKHTGERMITDWIAVLDHLLDALPLPPREAAAARQWALACTEARVAGQPFPPRPVLALAAGRPAEAEVVEVRPPEPEVLPAVRPTAP